MSFNKRYRSLQSLRQAYRRLIHYKYFPHLMSCLAIVILAIVIPALLTLGRPFPVPTDSKVQEDSKINQPNKSIHPSKANQETQSEKQVLSQFGLTGTLLSPKQTISVYLHKTKQVEVVSLEQYIMGVIAAEMPAKFELEALKAQAVAARTFIARRLAAGDVSGVPDNKADVTDTVAHQAYISKEELAGWSSNGSGDKLAKLKQAVKETEGIIMTYKGKPITASFFSASGGYTENSEDYWSQAVPYLRSVPSPWDPKLQENNEVTVSFSLDELFRKLDLSPPAIPATSMSEKSIASLFKTLSTTKGGKVKKISVNGIPMTGREVREKLDLRSSQFKIGYKDNKIQITTYGYGHGVGMSQWGAEGMARSGYSAAQILKYYYTGISFDQVEKLLSNKLSKK